MNTTEASRALMARYFGDLKDGDLGRHLTEDVTWINEETGQRLHGRTAVTAFVRTLHVQMGELTTRTYIVEDDAAMIEGDCLPVVAGAMPAERLPYVLVYDLTPDGIVAIRLYMSIARLPLGTQSRDARPAAPPP